MLLSMEAMEIQYWGVGIDDDIINASVKALISSVNRYERCEDGKED